MLPKEIQDDQSFYPSDETLDHLEVYQQLGKKLLGVYNDLYLQVKMYRNNTKGTFGFLLIEDKLLLETFISEYGRQRTSTKFRWLSFEPKVSKLPSARNM